MPQYLVPPENISKGAFRMTGPEARHVSRVMRIKPGETIEIFDGKGRKYLARLERFSGDFVAGKIISALDPLESERRLTLCFALVSRAAMEDILGHGAEVGVARFQPMITSRTQNPSAGKWPEKINRWNRILLASCKQCGRAAVPDINRPVRFESLLNTDIPSLIAWEKEKNVFPGEALGAALKKRPGRNDIRLFIGPEGGFTEAEVESAKSLGAVPFTFGKGILRTETAGIAASAIILNWGHNT